MWRAERPPPRRRGNKWLICLVFLARQLLAWKMRRLLGSVARSSIVLNKEENGDGNEIEALLGGVGHVGSGSARGHATRDDG
ncbi:MAG TPA: hypothetical protein VFZ28_15615 [Burkholderiaceae bacterium]|nr:hypothetical protein [Burkholderiaceae bacterium]